MAVPHFSIKMLHLKKSYISKILRGATIPIMLTKNQVKTISVHFIKKKFSVYLLSTHKKNLVTRKIMLIQNISHAC